MTEGYIKFNNGKRQRKVSQKPVSVYIYPRAVGGAFCGRIRYLVVSDIRTGEHQRAAVIVLVNVVVIWLMTAKMGVANQPGDIGKIVGITMMMILYIWILITTTNLFSALFGSTIGLSVGAAAHYAFVISARYGFENTLIKNINPLAVIFNMSENRRSIVTSVIVMGVILFAVCVIFCTYVNRSDVSLNNKEILV